MNHSSPIFYIPIWVSKTIEDAGPMLVIFFLNNKLEDERNIWTLHWSMMICVFETTYIISYLDAQGWPEWEHVM